MTATRNPARSAAAAWEELLERPLTARSVIASLLLGMARPRLSGARLVRWCELFGISEGTARVALSRMSERGELRADDGVYELAGRVRARQPAQDWSVHPHLDPWDGSWRLAVVVADGARTAGDRGALRDAMRQLRFELLREGVWTRPDNLPRAAAPAGAWEVARDQCAQWVGVPEEPAVVLAMQLFDPPAWAGRGVMLRRRLDRATAAVGSSTDAKWLAHAFVVGAAVLAHLRADPLLPPELCPRPWPGEALRAAYADYRGAFSEAVREWFRA